MHDASRLPHNSRYTTDLILALLHSSYNTDYGMKTRFDLLCRLPKTVLNHCRFTRNHAKLSSFECSVVQHSLYQSVTTRHS
jgi:hypothetical protein